MSNWSSLSFTSEKTFSLLLMPLFSLILTFGDLEHLIGSLVYIIICLAYGTVWHRNAQVDNFGLHGANFALYGATLVLRCRVCRHTLIADVVSTEKH